jgi:hypothetical protein
VVSTSLMVDTFSVPSLRNLLCAVNCALTFNLLIHDQLAASGRIVITERKHRAPTEQAD